jgi:uncharacterized membrane protein YhaH (DUF805 family)
MRPPAATNVPDCEWYASGADVMDWNFFFGFEGRINRAKCWRATALNFFCLLMFMLLVPLNIGSSFRDADPKWAIPFTIALLLGTLGPAIIISAWCFAAIAIKRLHDRDKSGWWIALFFIVPSLLEKLWDWLDNPTAAFFVSLLGFVLSVWSFVEIFCLRGTRGPNRFGSDPLARGNMRIDTASPAQA